MAKTFDNIFEAAATNFLFLFAQRTIALKKEPPAPPPLNVLGLPCEAIQALLNCRKRVTVAQTDEANAEELAKAEAVAKAAEKAKREVEKVPKEMRAIFETILKKKAETEAKGASGRGASINLEIIGHAAVGATSGGRSVGGGFSAVEEADSNSGSTASENEAAELNGAPGSRGGDALQGEHGGGGGAGGGGSDGAPVALSEIELSVTARFTCPEGKGAGDVMPIPAMRGGSAYEVTVPEGVVAGQTFQVQLPAVGMFEQTIAPLAKKITEYIIDHQDDVAQEERWRTSMKRDISKSFRMQREASTKMERDTAENFRELRKADKEQRELVDSQFDKQREEMQEVKDMHSEVQAMHSKLNQLVDRLANQRVVHIHS